MVIGFNERVARQEAGDYVWSIDTGSHENKE